MSYGPLCDPGGVPGVAPHAEGLTMSNTSELKTTFEAKKAQLEAELKRLKADAQGKGSDAIKSVEKRLSELNAEFSSKTNTSELKTRIEAKRAQLEAELKRLKSDAQGKGNEAIKAIEARLAEVNASVKEGWHNVSEEVAGKLNSWLKKS